MLDKGDSSCEVLILAPAANDGKIAAEVLNAAGISSQVCTQAEDLVKKMAEGCGAVVVSEEALTEGSIDLIQRGLEAQEAWSDLPIILLTSADVIKATEIFSKSGNISLLERPFSQLTLVRSVQVALRARLKQYEVRGLLHDLSSAKNEAERANFAKSQFLANMSHEIRTPIGAIMGFIDLIRNAGGGPGENLEYMEIIERNSQQLLRLIDDILDLSKVEAGKMTIEDVDFELADLLIGFVSSMKLKAAEKGIEFRIIFDTPIPEQIRLDPVRIRQVLFNVVGNAIKFTSKGWVELRISYHDPILRFDVRDTGIGLTKAQAKVIFDPFAQADPSTTRRFGGTGLGLALSQRLAEAMGGKLSLESSTLGVGSCFSMQLKTTRTPGSRMIGVEQLGMVVPQSNSSMDSEKLKGLKVLVVEDSVDNQVLIATYLRKTGARIDIKANGREGMEAALNGDFDVVLMDLQMPVMDGHEATKKLRSQHYLRPVIALTAHAMLEEKVRCVASGFTDYLTKPIRRNVLVDMLMHYK